MNSRIYFKIGTIFAWKEYKWYEKLWYAIKFKKLPFNRFYVCSKRSVPYFEHVTVFSPTKISEEERNKIRTYFAGNGYCNSIDELLINMQYVNNNITETDPNKWKNYKFRMKW